MAKSIIVYSNLIENQTRKLDSKKKCKDRKLAFIKANKGWGFCYLNVLE